MKFFVDRIENGEIVVCVDENQNIVELSIKKIKGHVVEGSIVKKEGKIFFVDEKETNLKRKEMFELQNDLFNN